MTRRSKLPLRVAAGFALIATCGLAVFGIVLWSDPGAALLTLRGSPHAVVRSEAIERGAYLLESFRLTTSSELEVELLVLRPASENPQPVLVLALDSEDILEVARDLPDRETCAFALISGEYRNEGLFGLRESSERVAASYLAAAEFLRGEDWCKTSPLHFAGSARCAYSAWLAARADHSIVEAWILGSELAPPRGLRNRVAHALAFGGGRAPDWQPGDPPTGKIARALKWLASRIAPNRLGTPARGLQRRAR